VRLNAGPARDKARTRLLELFETVGHADPAVLTARRNLTTALF
jgi:putative thioredoxin